MHKSHEQRERKLHMGVSKNNGIPKSSISIGSSIINHPFWGTPIFGNTHMKLIQKSMGLESLSGWWFLVSTNPLWKSMLVKMGGIFPQFSGWTFRKNMWAAASQLWQLSLSTILPCWPLIQAPKCDACGLPRQTCRASESQRHLGSRCGEWPGFFRAFLGPPTCHPPASFSFEGLRC